MKLGVKVLAAPILTAALVLSAATINTVLLVREGADNQASFKADLQSLRTIGTVQDQLGQIHASVYRTVALIGSMNEAQVRAFRGSLADRLNGLRLTLAGLVDTVQRDDQLRTSIVTAEAQIQRYRSHADLAIDLSAVDPNTGIAALQTADASYQGLTEVTGGMVARMEVMSNASMVRSSQRSNRNSLLLGLFGLAAAMLAIGLSWLMQRKVVTELSRTMSQLELAKVDAEDANRAKSAFLATMSHEIRTPMNGVIGMIEVLEQSSLAEDQTDAVQTIRASAFSLLALIDDILDFSKIEAGRLELEHTPVALPELVEAICGMLMLGAAAKGVDLHFFIAPDVPEHVWCDATRVRQTLNNLIGNAVKFSGGRPDVRGRVTVRVVRVADRPRFIALSVTDNGIGIAASTLDRLFKPFTQAEASTTRRFGGTGLGLVISRRLVTLMGGEIHVSSEQGVGSTFTVTLPVELVEGQAAREYPSLAEVDCVLIPGPGPTVADLGVYLEHAGARVHVATGIGLALDLVASIAPRTCVVIQHVHAGVAAESGVHTPFAICANARHLLLVAGATTHSRSNLSGIVTLADSNLRRASFLRAVAMAAGLEPVGTESLRAAVPATAHRRVAPSVARARAEGSLILAAEDDPINQKVILRQLAILGYAVEVASNGAEALRLWRKDRHALLLSDLHMPKLDGYGLARSIREEEARDSTSRHMPILALTANALRDEAGRVRAAGMDEYLTKPIQLAVLGAALERWLPHVTHGPIVAFAPPPETRDPRIASVVDVSVLVGLVGDDVETVHEFLTEFLRTARAQATEIVASCDANDNRGVETVAHKLKASSRSVGALELGDLCAELEKASRIGDRSEIAKWCVQFKLAMKAVDTCIVATLAEQVA
jgi:signal transduction histidine kinase/DNA-binding response OmpR family regulator